MGLRKAAPLTNPANWFNNLTNSKMVELIRFKPVDKRTIPEEVASNIRQLIFSGQLKPGSKLPPERELSIRFNTNRNTLREALRILQSQNLISVKQGAGVEVMDFRKSGEIALLSEFVKDGVYSPVSPKILEEILEFRRNLLVEIIPSSLYLLTEEHLKILRKLTKRMEENRKTPSAYKKIFELDAEFFRVLIEASGKILYVWLYNSMFKVGNSLMEIVRERWSYPDFYFKGMGKIYKAISAKNSKLLKKALSEHFKGMDSYIFSVAEKILKKGLT